MRNAPRAQKGGTESARVYNDVWSCIVRYDDSFYCIQIDCPLFRRNPIYLKTDRYRFQISVKYRGPMRLTYAITHSFSRLRCTRNFSCRLCVTTQSPIFCYLRETIAMYSRGVRGSLSSFRTKFNVESWVVTNDVVRTHRNYTLILSYVNDAFQCKLTRRSFSLSLSFFFLIFC